MSKDFSVGDIILVVKKDDDEIHYQGEVSDIINDMVTICNIEDSWVNINIKCYNVLTVWKKETSPKIPVDKSDFVAIHFNGREGQSSEFTNMTVLYALTAECVKHFSESGYCLIDEGMTTARYTGGDEIANLAAQGLVYEEYFLDEIIKNT